MSLPAQYIIGFQPIRMRVLSLVRYFMKPNIPLQLCLVIYYQTVILDANMYKIVLPFVAYILEVALSMIFLYTCNMQYSYTLIWYSFNMQYS